MSESKAKELRKNLMMKARKGAASFSEEQIKEAYDFAEGYKKFLDYSRTERGGGIYQEARRGSRLCGV